MENFTKRMKNAIIQEFVFHIVILLIFITGLFFYIFPTHKEISKNIAQLEELHQNLSKVEREWISFKDFYTDASNKLGENIYMRTLLSELDQTFYSKNFTNTGSKMFFDFLSEKKQNILEEKQSDSYLTRAEIIADILPVYGDVGDNNTKALSDFSFTNNLEELLFSFNLVSVDPIWVTDVKIVWSENSDWEEQSVQQESKLETSIYMIPLSLSLTWQKKDILDFLHYLENVGNIKIEGNKLVTYTDTVLPQLSSDIYKWQFVDIESVIMRKYIDTSPEPSSSDFINFIKTTQGREKFTVDITLRFYVTGFPKYKLETEVLNIVEESKKLQTEIAKSVKKYQNTSQDIQEGDIITTINQLKSLNLLMNPIIKDTQALQIELKQWKQDIDTIYKKAKWFDEKISQISQYYEKYKTLLETTK